jgi:hypothetical protein
MRAAPRVSILLLVGFASTADAPAAQCNSFSGDAQRGRNTTQGKFYAGLGLRVGL